MKFSDDLENWMGLLPQAIQETPIIHLAIPGSHDSCSYGIRKGNKIAPDAETIVRKLYHWIPCVVRRWAKTQTYSFEDQLKRGIRYFDLRVALNEKDNEMYFAHGVFCEKVVEPLKELYEFLDNHPKELVILDFQHFYSFSKNTHSQLMAMILNIFNQKIFYRSSEPQLDLTLSEAHSKRKQLIIIYRCQLRDSDIFYSSDDFPTPWPQTTKIDDLKNFLNDRLEIRAPNRGHCSQLVLTPDPTFIVRQFYSSLRSTCAKKVNKDMLGWIKEQCPGDIKENGRPKVNVMLADFTDIHNNEFTTTVIDLNMKLLEN